MVATLPDLLERDVARILAATAGGASRRKQSALTVLAGLPAMGKSRVAQELRARTGAVVLESDALRRLLIGRRTYSTLESQRLFAAIHVAAERLLAAGVSVIIDATNVSESERAPLYGMADRCNARLVLVHVTAPASVAKRRLSRRQAAGGGHSEADLRVFERMQARVEEIERPHHVVDTSQGTNAALAAIAKEMLGP